MAYHTIGRFQKRHYNATSLSSALTACVVITNRGKLLSVHQAVQANQTNAGTWTASLNGSAITGLSAVAVTTAVAGVQQTSASPTSVVYLAKDDVLSVAPSSTMASNYTFVVQEF